MSSHEGAVHAHSSRKDLGASILEALEKAMKRDPLRSTSPPLMGPENRVMAGKVLQSLEENCLRVVQAILRSRRSEPEENPFVSIPRTQLVPSIQTHSGSPSSRQIAASLIS